MARTSKQSSGDAVNVYPVGEYVHIRMSTRPEDKPRTRSYRCVTARDKEIRDAVRAVFANRRVVRREKDAVVIAVPAADIEKGKAIRIREWADRPSPSGGKQRRAKAGG